MRHKLKNEGMNETFNERYNCMQAMKHILILKSSADVT